MSTEVDDFLAATMPRLNQAEAALHSGDAAPRFAMWSHEDPVTVFGAARNVVGWTEIGPAFEHTSTSINGAPPQPYVLRVTTVFRREGGEWKVVHRHADPASESAVALAERLSSTLG